MVMKLLGALIPAPHTVKHRAQLDDAGDGARWASAVDVAGCRIERSSRQYQNADGRVVTLTAMVWMPAMPEVKVGDRLVLDGNERRVEKIDELVDLEGNVMHREVWTA
ncbi:hypothetical protein Lesp02_70810 [Lentzea sp. NBRC 105346]|uniref:hypothetical protein n=1 Tax=Lentzea sp. NBRC 105346 TaxID=3032205 RepID=UPI0024A584A9|nr:hypothetical protein [Lentzea sp. NBRC 105346]GLZ34894.1 hypothetical protein Lesp02_70810 [Lentzea sp. NBRC 105346]